MEISITSSSSSSAVPTLAGITDAATQPPAVVTEALQMLEKLLAQRGRRLTAQQWELVTPRMAEEPTALYVRLALRVVSESISD